MNKNRVSLNQSASTDLFQTIIKDNISEFLKICFEREITSEQLSKYRRHCGYTLLGFAVTRGSLSIASYLIDQKINLNTPCKKSNETPLHTAIRYGTFLFLFYIFKYLFNLLSHLDQYSICEMLLECPNLDVNFDYGDPYFTPLQHAWKRIYNFDVACTIVKKIIRHPQFHYSPSKHILCYRYWPRENADKQKNMFNWLISAGVQFASGQSPKLFEVENLFKLCTLLDSQPTDGRLRRSSTLKELCRDVIVSRLVKSTGKTVTGKTQLQSILPLPEELCTFMANKPAIFTDIHYWKSKATLSFTIIAIF